MVMISKSKKPRAAVKQVAAYFLQCPHCGGDIVALGGSLMFALEDCDGSVRLCPDCDEPVRLPRLEQ